MVKHFHENVPELIAARKNKHCLLRVEKRRLCSGFGAFWTTSFINAASNRTRAASLCSRRTTGSPICLLLSCILPWKLQNMCLVVYDLGMIQTGMNHPLVRIWVGIKMTQDFHYNLVDYTDLAIIKDVNSWGQHPDRDCRGLWCPHTMYSAGTDRKYFTQWHYQCNLELKI